MPLDRVEIPDIRERYGMIIIRTGDVPDNAVNVLRKQAKAPDGRIVDITWVHAECIHEALQKFANDYGVDLRGVDIFEGILSLNNALRNEGYNAPETKALITDLLRSTLQTELRFDDGAILVVAHDYSGGSSAPALTRLFWYLILLTDYGVISDGLFVRTLLNGRDKLMSLNDLLEDINL